MLLFVVTNGLQRLGTTSDVLVSQWTCLVLVGLTGLSYHPILARHNLMLTGSMPCCGCQVAFRWERRLSVAYFFLGWNALLAIGYLWYRERQQREITGDERADKINRGQSAAAGCGSGRLKMRRPYTARQSGLEREIVWIMCVPWPLDRSCENDVSCLTGISRQYHI